MENNNLQKNEPNEPIKSMIYASRSTGRAQNWSFSKSSPIILLI